MQQCLRPSDIEGETRWGSGSLRDDSKGVDDSLMGGRGVKWRFLSLMITTIGISSFLASSFRYPSPSEKRYEKNN